MYTIGYRNYDHHQWRNDRNAIEGIANKAKSSHSTNNGVEGMCQYAHAQGGRLKAVTDRNDAGENYKR